MSVNVTAASLTPSTVYAGTQFIISIEVYDDIFEFSTTNLVYDVHQGFSDLAQTIGGKFVDDSPPEAKCLRDTNGLLLLDSNGCYLINNNGVAYIVSHTAEQVDAFLEEVLDG